jgi:hypothetical protein
MKRFTLLRTASRMLGINLYENCTIVQLLLSQKNLTVLVR